MATLFPRLGLPLRLYNAILRIKDARTRDKQRNKLKEWENKNRQTSDLFAQNLREKLSAIKTKIDRLMDGYFEGGFELAEFQEKKNKLMTEKKDIEEKLSDFERK